MIIQPDSAHPFIANIRKILSTKGRISRLQYLQWHLVLSNFALVYNSLFLRDSSILLPFISTFFISLFQLRRFDSLERCGWLTLLIFIPIYLQWNFIFINYMLFFSEGYIAIKLFAIGVFIIPSLQIQRLHDLGHSGWCIFLIFIPVIDAFLYIYLLCAQGNTCDNEYGALIKSRKLNMFEMIWLYTPVALYLPIIVFSFCMKYLFFYTTSIMFLVTPFEIWSKIGATLIWFLIDPIPSKPLDIPFR
jgi:uncharacterized membrane protein YhaH (DUF805 family)